MTGYQTQYGQAVVADSLKHLQTLEDDSIDLVMTSPPFALLRKKEYGNKDQHEYVEWLAQFARVVFQKLKPTGSFVLDLGGAYMPGLPVRSLYNFRVPIYFCDEIGFHLAEEFYWYNSSKLPSPIEWVNKRKIRAKDSVNNIWWFSKTPYPKANVSNVLAPYSDRMKKLLADPDGFFSPKLRPSGHDVGRSFASDNGGAIPSNLLQIPNSESNSAYLAACKRLSIKSHPARFPVQLPEFFIKFLTDEGDFVVDIFGGSATTGQACEKHKRRWLCMDMDAQYVAASAFRFLAKTSDTNLLLKIYATILEGGCVNLMDAQLSGLEVSDNLLSKVIGLLSKTGHQASFDEVL